MFAFLICIALSLLLALGETNVNASYYLTNCTNKFHDHEAVATSVEKAKLLLQKQSDPKNVPMIQRLLMMMLFSSGFVDSDLAKINYLRCSLNKLKMNMMPTNTVDIFIWVLKKPGVDLTIPEWLAAIPRVNVMEIEPSTWIVPCGLKDDSEWALRYRFPFDYYLMGRWRLTFSFDFARAMGYAYHMQYDDDSILNSKVPYNLAADLAHGEYHMGVFSHAVDEIPEVVTGLPELTRYWLTINNHTPVGPLFKHFVPHNLEGLTLPGWDRMYFRGYAIVTSVDFWFQRDVQDFLTTVLRSGRDVEGRWQEQAVMNMIRLIFIPETKLFHGRVFDVGHDRSNNQNFYGWCVRGKFL